MKKYLQLLILTVATAMTAMAAETGAPFNHGRLKVDATGRYLEHADGTPFLYMGDTAWELLARLNYKEACRYLDNRAAKGFTVIQAVVLTELDGLTEAQEPYLEHIDSVLTYAEQLGLYMALVPTWGDKVDKQWGQGPEVFQPGNARAYGNLLAKRWHQRPNIIWIIGGDRSGEGKNKAVWNALAQGIKEVDRQHLMTYHPHGEHSSAMWFHQEDWLDFNMIQTGHCQQDYTIYRRLLWPDRTLTPTKPVMDGEPRYEDIPRNFKPEEGRFTASDVRRTLYQSMLSGACGYTYGNNNIWQMYAPGREPQCHADKYWYEALDMDGACQLIHFIQLWQETAFSKGHPMPNSVKACDGYSEDEAVAFETKDNIICYFPGGKQWVLDLPDAWQEGYEVQWMDPRTGEITILGTDSSRQLHVMLPASTADKADWVIIIKKHQSN